MVEPKLIQPPPGVNKKLLEFQRLRQSIIQKLLNGYTELQPRWKKSSEKKVPYTIEPREWKSLSDECILAQHLIPHLSTNELLCKRYNARARWREGCRVIYVREAGAIELFELDIKLANTSADQELPREGGKRQKKKRRSNRPVSSWHDTLIEIVKLSDGSLNSTSRPKDLRRELELKEWLEERTEDGTERVRVWIIEDECWSDPIKYKTFANISRCALDQKLTPHDD